MQDGSARHIIVAGAGIAGFTAALGFARRGFPVRLFEQAPRIEDVGAGLQLSPNATRILRELGVLEGLLPKAVRPEAIVLKDAATLRELASVPMGAFAEHRWGAPYLVAHRADLQGTLLESAIETRAIEFAGATRVTGAQLLGQSLSVRIDGGAGMAETPGHLLVAADGVWSMLRRSVGSGAESRFAGEIAWRTMIAADSPAGELFLAVSRMDCVTTFLHRRFHLVAYPVRSGSAVNLVAFTPGRSLPHGWAAASDGRVLHSAMHGTAAALARLVQSVPDWTVWPLHTVDPAGPWTDGSRIALIGDAAHALTPFAAQGAAMAIEDAETLARAVAANQGDLPAALKSWEALRKPRVARVARRGTLNHFAWHAGGPVAMARNAVLKLRAPEALAGDLDWLYGWKPS